MARIIVAIFILLLGFIDLAVISVSGRYFWAATWLMSLLDSLIFLFYPFFVDCIFESRAAFFMRQLAHWLGFYALFFIIYYLLYMGTFVPQSAGLMLFVLLGFSLYVAGIYIDWLLSLVGLMLVWMGVSVVLFQAHLWLLVLPVLVFFGLLVALSSEIKTRGQLLNE